MQEPTEYATDNSDSMSEASKVSSHGKLPVLDSMQNTTGVTHLSGPKLYANIGALSLVVLMIGMDSTIISTAVPKITDQFDTIADVGWYGAAYMLAIASLQPLSGKVYTYAPLTTSFLVFILIFSIGSVVCATAASSSVLVVGRAICGIGGSGLVNGAMTILGTVAPARQRPILLSIVMSVMGASQIIGPLVGGVLTERASWRWCFWINLPIAICAAAGLVFTRAPNPDQKRNLTLSTFFTKFDIMGFFLFAPACVMLLLALQWGGIRYAWNSAMEIGLFGGAAVAMSMFLCWEWHHGDDAMFPPCLMKRRIVWSSCLNTAMLGGFAILLSYYLPLWFQAIKRRSPIGSAVNTLPSFLTEIVGALVSGFLVSKCGYITPFATLGSVLSTISAGFMSTLRPSSGISAWAGYQVLAGLGRGISMQQPILAVQASLSGADMSTGMAVVAWAQFMGGAIFIAVGQTTFSNLLRIYISQSVPTIDASTVINAGATDYLHLATGPAADRLLLAYNSAITHTFYLATGAAAIATISALGMGWQRLGKIQDSPAREEKV